MIDDLRADVDDLFSLALDCVDTVPLLPEILPLAAERDIWVDDATYLVTAQSLGIPLLTADVRLWRKLEGVEGEALLLADWGSVEDGRGAFRLHPLTDEGITFTVGVGDANG